MRCSEFGQARGAQKIPRCHPENGGVLRDSMVSWHQRLDRARQTTKPNLLPLSLNSAGNALAA